MAAETRARSNANGAGPGHDGPPHLSDWMRMFLRHAFRPDRRNIAHWLSWALALGVEWALVVMLWDGQIYAWEQRLMRWIQDLPGHRLVFQVTSNLTNTLSLGFLLGLAALAIVLYVWHRRTIMALLLLTFPLHVLAQFPKALVDRPRPSEEFSGIDGVGGFQSFPSGHSEYVITFYGFIAYLLMARYQSLPARCLIFAAWLLFALGTGYGRMAAGRHWPLDVFGSYIIGFGLLSGMVWINRAVTRTRRQSLLY